MVRYTKKIYEERVKRAGKLMIEEGIDALLLVKPQNMQYLTGDGRLCSFAVVTKEGRTIVGIPKTDLIDVKKHSYSEKIIGFENEIEMLHSLMHIWKELGLTEGKVGVEHTFLKVSMYNMFQHPHAKPEDLEFVDATPIMANLRLIKSKEEIEIMKEVGKIADAGMDAAIKAVKEGTTEIDIAGEAEYAMRKKGAEGFYTTYISSGPRSTIAHGIPYYRKIEKGDFVMIDLHPVYKSYCADICRTVCFGKTTDKQKRAFEVYLKAQRSAVQSVGPKATMSGVEKVMHEVIEKEGYKEYFIGPPIHGVGMEFEEPPLPSAHAFFHGEKPIDDLKSGMVISIGNCGLYLGDFGVRVEDTIMITDKGYEEITNYKRDLI